MSDAKQSFERGGVAWLWITFVLLIGMGTLAIKLPAATPMHSPIGWVDAVYTMTSAVCVTGLTVRETGAGFTPIGQAILAGFVQLGGLAILIFGTVVAMRLGVCGRWGRRLSLRKIVGLAVAVTLAFEAIGAAAMVPLWPGDRELGERIGLSVFHAISAYCNAGLTTLPGGFESMRYHVIPHVVLAVLVVAGGIGLPVMVDVGRAIARRSAGISLHTRLVLTTTAGLFIVGMLLLAGADLSQHLRPPAQTANQPTRAALETARVGEIAADAGFMSLSARTAGFSTTPMHDLDRAQRVTLMGLMLVGASPGSVGGGMKTTTLAVLLLAGFATLRGRRRGARLAMMALTLAMSFVALVGLATLLLCVSEPYPVDALAFEAVSAAGTTGWSVLPGPLTAFGKVVIIMTMLAGRVGPLALVVVMARQAGGRLRAPVMLG